jgi:hypothetical protein
MEGRIVPTRGDDSLSADESLGLNPKGQKGREIGDSQCFEINPASGGVARRSRVFTPEPVSDSGKKGAMLSHQAISAFGDRGDSGNFAVQPGKPSEPGSGGEGVKDGFGSAENGSIRLDELDRGLELSPGDCGKTGGDFLEGSIVHAITGKGLPVGDPAPAKSAIAIENEERLLHGLNITQEWEGVLGGEGAPLGKCWNFVGNGKPGEIRRDPEST